MKNYQGQECKFYLKNLQNKIKHKNITKNLRIKILKKINDL